MSYELTDDEWAAIKPLSKYVRSCALSTNGAIGRPLIPAFVTSALLQRS